MKNELQKHKKSDGIKWFATLLAVLMLAVAVTAAITQGFKNWNPYGWFDKKEAQSLPEENGGAVISESTGNGITVKSVSIPKSEYAENGVSPLAETAYTLTATVSPNNEGENTGIDWSYAFKNPESEWATGKTLSDYVTFTKSGEDLAGSKKITVSCLQAFAEQVIITATSQDKPEITASCTVDYAQRIENAVVKFGNLNINLGGQTNVTWELNPAGTGMGGAVSATCTKSSVYSLADDFEYKVELTREQTTGAENTFTLNDRLVTYGPGYDGDSYDISSDSILFNKALFSKFREFYFETRQGSEYLKDKTTAELIGLFSNITVGKLWTVKVTFTGKYSTYTNLSLIVVTGYTNTSTVTNIDLDNSSIIF